MRVLSEGRADIDRAPTSIGDWCHIGAGVIVAKGVTIGDHVVVGAGAFVNRDVAPRTVVVGVPARPIGRVVITGDGDVSLVYDKAE